MRYSLLFSFLLLSLIGKSQEVVLKDQFTALSKEQIDSMRKELNIAIDVSDEYVSKNYKQETNLEVLYLIIRLDEYFLLSKTMADESKVSDIRGNNNYVLNLYNATAGVLPNPDVIEANLGMMKLENFDEMLSSEIAISVWCEIANKYPMPPNALLSMHKYFDKNPILQAKGLLAFYNLYQKQKDTLVLSHLNYFRDKILTNLTMPANELNPRNGWAARVMSMATYLYTSKASEIPIIDWTKELKFYLKNGYGVMSGNELEGIDKYTNIYGLWAILELKERTNRK